MFKIDSINGKSPILTPMTTHISTIPFVGVQRELYESDIFDANILKLMGRRTSMHYLQDMPVGSWIVRHSSFQNLLFIEDAFTTSFSEKVSAFYAISVKQDRPILHYLIAEVSPSKYYFLSVQKGNFLQAVTSTPLGFKDILEFLGLTSDQSVYEAIQDREYINM